MLPGVGFANATTTTSEPSYESQRAPFLAAKKAARAGDKRRFDSLAKGLVDYPLSSYLAYESLLSQRYRIDGESARRFVDANRDSPLGVRFLGHYLNAAGSRRRWDDFLTAAQREPRSEALRCYYYRAQLAAGEREQAWVGAAKLWTTGRSVNDACDPLFSAWQRAGQITDERVWARATLAYDARKFGLLRYVASLGSATLQPDLEVLQRSYREPQRTRVLVQDASASRRSDILARGLRRYSRYDPSRSLSHWQALDRAAFTDAQVNELEGTIALRGLLERETDVRDWADASLGLWGDTTLAETRLRWAIEEKDWSGILKIARYLDDVTLEDPLWGYWRARALEAMGKQQEAAPLYASAARARSYYGFLSADRIGVPYSFNDENLSAVPGGVGLPAHAQETVARVRELQALDESLDAHAEWAHLLGRADREGQRQLAMVAVQNGWYRFAIDAANASGSSNALSLRFPLAYTDIFRAPAARQSLPLSELMAIARRESAFFPAARSSAGARGLMQLMPATGLGIAKRQGLKLSTSDLYDLQHNVDLGSAYYRQLLERFDDNRPVALAAYNAGPNRVKHWVGRGLPLDAWIETIPYRETRAYVKAVLAYSVVFDYRLGQDASLLSASERLSAY